MALRPRQAKHRSQPGPYAGRDRYVPPLLYPGVPGNTDTGQLGDLFAAQAGRAPPNPGRQAQRFGLHAGARGAQEVSQRLASSLALHGRRSAAWHAGSCAWLAQAAGQCATYIVLAAAAALHVVLDLIVADIADIEVLRHGVAKIKARDAGRRVHGVAVSQLHADIFAFHDAEHVLLDDVLGAGGITRRRPDALVLFSDDVLVGQRLVGSITPQIAAYPRMQGLGEPFCQSVGDGLEHDAGVIVVIVQEGLV